MVTLSSCVNVNEISTITIETSSPDEAPEEAMEEDKPSPDHNTSTHVVANSSTSSRQHPSMAAAQFILKTRDGRKLPETILDGILQDTRGFLEQTVSNLFESVKLKLNKLSSDEVSDVLDLFSASNITKDLETQFKQEDFFQEHLNYVVRKRIFFCVIGTVIRHHISTLHYL